MSIGLGLFVSGVFCFFANANLNYLGGWLGLIVMLFYILFNLNPFLAANNNHRPYKLLEEVMKSLFIEYLSILGVFIFIITNSTRGKHENIRNDRYDPREEFAR